MIPAASSARPFASAICPSSRLTQTGFSGVISSIHLRSGSSPPHCSWSQSPPRIHSPGCRVSAKAEMRPANSSGVRASLSCTEARRKPPVMKCTCESMKPGVNMAAPASRRVASLSAIRFISSSEPTARIVLPSMTTPSAHGCSGFPVQIRALWIIVCVDGAVQPARNKRARRRELVEGMGSRWLAGYFARGCSLLLARCARWLFRSRGSLLLARLCSLVISLAMLAVIGSLCSLVTTLAMLAG